MVDRHLRRWILIVLWATTLMLLFQFSFPRRRVTIINNFMGGGSLLIHNLVVEALACLILILDTMVSCRRLGRSSYDWFMLGACNSTTVFIATAL